MPVRSRRRAGPVGSRGFGVPMIVRLISAFSVVLADDPSIVRATLDVSSESGDEELPLVESDAWLLRSWSPSG